MQQEVPRNVFFQPVSVETGSAPFIIIAPGLLSENVASVEWAISRVEKDFTELALASSSIPHNE